MSARMSLRDFLDRLEGVYKSIDLRIAAAKVGDTWQNALTVVRFSYKEPREVEEWQRQLESKWGMVKTENFSIKLLAWPVDKLDVLCEQLSQGRLKAPEISVEFGRSIELLSIEGRFDNYGYARRGELRSWPSLEAFDGQYRRLLDEEQLQAQVKSQTLLDPSALIRELLEVDFYLGRLSLDLVVAAPFYAAIQKVDFGEQWCKIQVEFHKDIKALAVSAVVRRGDPDDSPLRDKARSTINLEESEESGQYMRLWTKQLDLLEATPADYLSVNLMQIEPTALDIDLSPSTKISQLLESKRTGKAPLVAACRRFLTEDELEQYLTKPIGAAWPYKKGSKDAGDTFELAVAWLLGLCGFNIVWLGQTKHETLRENRVTRFSIDMLASHHESKNLLVLIGCTIGSPNNKDIDNLKSVRKILQDEVFKDTQLQVKPLVLSAAPELSNKERDGVKVLDGDDIRGILNHIRQGQIQHALSEYFGYELGFKTGS
jgi:hypothetical protein